MTNLLFSILPILSTNSLIISIDGENKTAIIVSKIFFLLIKLALMPYFTGALRLTNKSTAPNTISSEFLILFIFL